MNTAIKNDISKVNSILFSNIGLNANPSQVDQHFTKFTKFIRCQPAAVLADLSEIIPPLLCHLYIDMLRGRDWRPAIEFLRKHAPLVGKTDASSGAPVGPSSGSGVTNLLLPLLQQTQQQKLNGTVDANDQRDDQRTLPTASAVQNSIIHFAPSPADSERTQLYKRLIHTLSQLTHMQDCDSDPLVVQFRSCQTQLRLRSASIATLRQYLAKHGHSIILQPLRTWFCFETVEDKNIIDYSPGSGGAASTQSTGQREASVVQPQGSNANGQLTNGVPNELGERSQSQDQTQKSATLSAEGANEYDFGEHTAHENEQYLLLNGFNKPYIQYRLLEEAENGMSGGHLLTNDEDEEDDDDDDANDASVAATVMTESHQQPESTNDNGAGLSALGFPRRLTTQERLKRLQESAEKLMLYEPPLCVYSLENVGHQLTSVAIDPSCCHVASGFENSTIMLWSTNRSTQMGRKPYASLRDRGCSWNVTACDNRFSESEDSEDDDDDDGGGGAGVTDEERGSGSRSMFDLKSKADLGRINKLLPPHSRRKTKRERWKQFLERRCLDNTFTETGGVALRGHTNAVTDLLFSEHDPLLMSVSRDCTMRAWTGHDYNCRAVYRGHNHPIWTVAESPTGLFLATGSRDTTARLWSTDRKFPLMLYAGHTQDVDTIAFHPNGSYLATGSTDLTVRMWCVTSGKQLRLFTDCRQPVQRVCFSPDGKYLAAGGEESRVHIFDLAAGAQLTELKDHTAAISCATWSPDSRHFVSSCVDGTIRIWDAKRMLSTTVDTATASAMTSSVSSTHHTQQSSQATVLNNGTSISNPKMNITSNLPAQQHPASAARNSGSTAQAQVASGVGVQTSDPAAAVSGTSAGPPPDPASVPSAASDGNLLLAYSTGCRRIYRLHYNKLDGGLCCIGSS
uniref:Putative transcription initiation factor tfiid n=1 Tax=Anopheles marajoara TaxID=58244 RepID=A0A2M4BCW0_9DIPT